MSALPPSPSQSDVQTALVAFLTAIMPTGVEIFEGLDNKVPEPSETDFIVMTVLRRPRLATNVDTLNDAGDETSIEQSTQVVFQLDVHSADLATASDNAQTISTLFRDQFAVSFFQAYPGITPLYCDEPRLIAFQNAEQQYEPRYMIEAHLQADQVVTVPAQSATAAVVGVISVTEAFPA